MNVSELSGEMFPGNDAANMIAFPVGPSHVNSLAEGEVCDYAEVPAGRQAHRPEEPGFDTRVLFHFFPVGRAKIAHQASEFFFVKRMVSPHESQNRPLRPHQKQRFDGQPGVDAQLGGDFIDGARVRSGNLLQLPGGKGGDRRLGLG